MLLVICGLHSRYSPPVGGSLTGAGMRTIELGLDIMPVLTAKEKPPINVVGDVGMLCYRLTQSEE